MIRIIGMVAGVMAGLLMAPAALAAPPDPATVTVTRSGLHQAAVTDSLGQINCGTACTGSYAYECSGDNGHGACIGWSPIDVTLSTAPPAGFGVVWSGVTCGEGNTSNDCTFAGPANVNAHFRDLTAPDVSLTSPPTGLAKGTIQLTATASDVQTGVQKVQFSVGGTPVGPADTSAPYGVSFDTTGRSDGAVQVSAVATNNDGTVASVNRSITIDNTAPDLDVTSGPSGQTFGPGTTQEWEFDATDANGVAAVECSVVTAGAPASFGACSGVDTSHSVANKPDGSYTFTVRARDAGGLVTTAAARTFTIDATPPETTVISGPADGSSSTDTTAAFGFSAGQAGSTFECRVYPAALTPPAFGACSAAAGHTATGFAPGTYSFEVRATDPYGNTDATPAKRTFTVTAPGGGDPGPGAGTDTGTGGTGGTTTGGTTTGGTTTTTTTTTTIVTTTVFDPRITSLFAYKGAKTRFTQLVITRLPKGAKVQLVCAGKGCAFKRKSVANKGAKLNVLKALKRLNLRAGAVLQLRITGAAGELKVATWKVRRGRAPSTTYRCAATRGAKLRACT